MNILNANVGMDFTAPPAPESAQMYLPDQVESFGDGLWYVMKQAFSQIAPSITEAAGICLSIVAVVLLLSLLRHCSARTKRPVELVGTIAVAMLLLQPSNALINLGVSTVQQINEYGKVLLPVMTAALAAQGGITTSTALYAATAVFNTVITSVLLKLLVPLIYIYAVLCIAMAAIREEFLVNLQKFVKWLITWILKIILYVFTGYMAITKVVSGTVDAAAIKAAKITISGAVPVVGSIISDASEAILVSAGVMKSTAGVFGLLTVMALWIGPFLEIAVQYLLLKATAAICGVFGEKQAVGLVKNFSGTMGFLLAMTGTVCLIFLISTVCFMKGVT